MLTKRELVDNAVEEMQPQHAWEAAAPHGRQDPFTEAQVVPRQHPARHPHIRIRAMSNLYLERARIPRWFSRRPAESKVAEAGQLAEAFADA
jgi:hypothetical protein